jgi:hypothetical protein
MRGQRQGVRSTRVAEPTEDVPTNIPHQKKKDILITEHEIKSLMYADQTGLFSGSIEPWQQVCHDLAPC